MTFVERKLRMSLWLMIENHTAEAIDNALAELIPKFGDKYIEVFKSITGDNGSEFANLSKLESIGIQVYFTHPYTSCEKEQMSVITCRDGMSSVTKQVKMHRNWLKNKGFREIC